MKTSRKNRKKNVKSSGDECALRQGRVKPLRRHPHQQNATIKIRTVQGRR